MTSRTCSTKSFARRSAFSLLETGVVLTVIGLLLVVLQPSIKVAREKTKRMTCLDRLRGLAEASRIYTADDPNGMAIPVHPKQLDQCPGQLSGGTCTYPIYIGAYEWGGKSGIGRQDFLTGAPGDYQNSKYGSKAGFGPAARPLNAILYPRGFANAFESGRFNRYTGERDIHLELDAYRCPGDDGPPLGAHCPDWTDNPGRSSYDHFGNSYTANLFMVSRPGGVLAPGFEVNETGSNSPYLRNVSRISNTTRTILYEENIGRWAWACRRELDSAHDATGSGGCLWLGSGVDPGSTKHLRGWHGKEWTYNRGFIDAHAETQSMYNEGTEDVYGYANHYRNEVVYGDDRDQSARCIIVRGDGWQKDTLPAPYIRTHLLYAGSGRADFEDCVQMTVKSTTSGDAGLCDAVR